MFSLTLPNMRAIRTHRPHVNVNYQTGSFVVNINIYMLVYMRNA